MHQLYHIGRARTIGCRRFKGLKWGDRLADTDRLSGHGGPARHDNTDDCNKGPKMSDFADHRARIVTVGLHDTIGQAAAKMLSHNVGCLIVNDDDGKFIGLVTEQDIARQVAVSPDRGEQIPVARIMTDHVLSCPPGTVTSEARRIMTTHGIRHLPIVEKGAVVGILSARDIMRRQLLEDRAAAEEVAMLSKCLKSIDLDEAAEIVSVEVAKLFEAKNCLLCLYPDGDRNSEPEVVSANRCPRIDCGAGIGDCGLAAGHAEAPLGSAESYYDAEISAKCSDLGGLGPRLVLPLEIVGLSEVPSGEEKRLTGYLCLCGLASASATNRELTSYKAKLTREIIVAHLTNATRYQQARLSSLTDPLTGAGSRKLLEDKLDEEHDRARRYEHPFSLAIIDLDHFKMVNDTLGHATGDEAIRQLAECIKHEKRAPDVLARYGGDEFVLLLPETKATDATVLLERIRTKVRQIGIGGSAAQTDAPGNPDQEMALSVSCGIAESAPESDEAARDVMRRADIALYEAKGSGRNCVKRWHEDMMRLFSSSDIEIERIKNLQRRLIGLSEKAEKLFMESIWSLVQALEAKDTFAKKHSENVTAYAVGIARTMELGPRHVDLIRRAAMIHDIGKIGVPDAILFKPDCLTAHERRLVEQHPMIAVRILEKMSFLENETAIIRHHHERWNGQGYPDCLVRTAIPLGARIIAVADTFDALTSNRAYHTCRPVAEVLRMLADACGYDFDPAVVTAMIAWVEGIAKRRGTTLDRLTIQDLRVPQQPAAKNAILAETLVTEAVGLASA